MANNTKLPPHIQTKTIVEIGDLFNEVFVSHMKFLSDDYFLDADVLLISIKAMQLEFSQMMRVENITNYVMPPEKLEIWKEKVAQRRKQLEMYLDSGGVLFVFVDNDPIYPYQLGDSSNSDKSKTDFREILLLNPEELKTEKMSGSNIVYADGIYKDFFEPWDVGYNFVYTKFKGFLTAKVKNTNQAISVAVPHGKGLIFLLPDLKLSADDYQDYENRLFDARIAILNFIQRYEESKPQVQNIGLPDWCANYFLGKEIDEVTKLKDLENDLAELHQKISSQLEMLDSYNLLKQMLSATGKSLEGIVEFLLAKLGFEFLPTEPGRDDLIIKSDDQIAVIEIKGVKGSASEQNATQLMKWVNNYHHVNNVGPKGILIVNAFKDIEPNKRKEEAFPHQMLAYSNRMQFCLMTTYQLLGLYLDYEAGDLSFIEIKNILFNSIGRLEYSPSKIIYQSTDQKTLNDKNTRLI